MQERQPSHTAHASLPAHPLLPILALSLRGEAQDKTKMKSPSCIGDGWIPGAILACASSQLGSFKSNPCVKQPWKEWFSPFQTHFFSSLHVLLRQGVAQPWGKIIFDVVAAGCVTAYSWSWQSFWSSIPCPGVDQTRGSGSAWH